MRKIKRPISFLLLFIFGFLSLKNLFSNFNENSVNNCQEFGHIHIYKSHKTSGSKMDLKPTHSLATNTDDNEDCREGKLVLNHVLFPDRVFQFKTVVYKMSYSLIFTIEDHFMSPYLEPLRKPPRLS